jgi:hypothetical protein
LSDDYANITDNRSGNDHVVIRWWAAPTVSPGTALSALLEQYVVISVVRFRFDQPNGSLTIDKIDSLEARDRSDKSLVLARKEDLPPAAVGTLAVLETAMRQSLGRVGDGLKFFMFAAGTIHACEKGRLSVPFADETYTWDTPFPGC